MKFGGTSMGSAERIRASAQIAADQHKTRPTVAVVSAMSKITDLLLDTMKHAEGGDAKGLEGKIDQLKIRHEQACLELLPPEKHSEAFSTIRSLISEFARIASGMMMLGDRPPRSVDEAVAIGERLSAYLMSAYLETAGIPSVAISGSDLIVTDAVFGNATPLMDQTRARTREKLLPLLEQGILPVVTGFNGATSDGRPTTLGRGGSDFSASILAAAIDAEELWIWTDVDGIMSADPRLVPDAAVLDVVTYREAAELAYNGAKVLHPRTLAPLVEKGIPVWSKNSFNLNVPGTRIVPDLVEPVGARAVTSMIDVALVSLEPANAAVSGTRVMARALEALAQANAEVLAMSSSSYRQSFCFPVAALGTRGGAGVFGVVSIARTDARVSEADRGGSERRAVGDCGRGDARHSGHGGADLHGDLEGAGEHHCDRAGLERVNDFDCGVATRSGEGGEGDPHGVRIGGGASGFGRVEGGAPVQACLPPGALRDARLECNRSLLSSAA